MTSELTTKALPQHPSVKSFTTSMAMLPLPEACWPLKAEDSFRVVGYTGGFIRLMSPGLGSLA